MARSTPKTVTSEVKTKSGYTRESPHARRRGRTAPGELELSRRVQQAMIPRSLPAVNGLDIRSWYAPHDEVAGDLYDVVHINEDLLVFYMVDIAERGTAAALISALIKVSFQNHLRETGSASAVLERVNTDLMRAVNGDSLISAFVAYLDLHNNKLTYATAEHPFPLVYRKQEQTLVELRAAGMKLGVSKGAHFEEESIYLLPGDRVFIFTDGVYGLFDGNAHERAAAFHRALHQEDVPVGPLIKAMQDRCAARATADQLIVDDVSMVAVDILTQSRKNQIKEKLGFTKDDPVYLQFISYYEEMDSATSVILKEMDVAGFPDETIRKMKISLTELLANAIGHGNGEDHSRKVTIGHIVNRQVATVSIMDEGGGFDPTTLPDPTLPENLIKDHGRGLYIVSNYVDEIEHNAEGNRILIRKFHV